LTDFQSGERQDYRWRPVSSLECCDDSAPLLDREAFVEALANVPPKPDEMEQILAFNRGRTASTVHA
jgi:hypothetical protein